MRYAEEDLASAGLHIATALVLPKQACYHAQQAGEKALKSLLILRGVVFPRTHDLLALWQLQPAPDQHVADGRALGALSSWVVVARYPAEDDEATMQDAQAAIAAATT